MRIMKLSLTTFFAAFSLTLALGQSGFWSDIAEKDMVLPENSEWEALPTQYRTLSLQFEDLKTHLQNAPMELSAAAKDHPVEVTLPLPDGSMRQFLVYQSPTMHPDLAAQFPGIKAFAGWEKGNYANRVRLDYGKPGFHAMIKADGQTFYIEPYASNQTQYYIAFNKKDFSVDYLKMPPLSCGFDPANMDDPGTANDGNIAQNRGGGKGGSPEFGPMSLRKYDLALACTGEYAQSHGGDVPSVLATFNTAINRVNELIQSQMGAKLELIPLTTLVIFLDPNSDPYNNSNMGGALLEQNKTVLNQVLGADAFDVGHVFTGPCTDVGGVVSGTVCGPNKARGVTCHYSGSVIFIAENVMAHEMAHQFSASHTWSNCPGSEGQLASNTAFEPGSGTTIMSYSGACGSENIGDSDTYYHGASIEQFTTFSRTGGGSGCPDVIPTDNNEPQITDFPYEDGFYIPIRTPFELHATATDPDGDQVYYCWEQFDLGPVSTLGNPIGNAPSFRSFPPTTDPSRVFPKLQTVLSNGFDKTEVLPTYSRDLTFRCTVRDLHPVAGGVAWEQVAFKATDQAGPFLVTNPTTGFEEWTGGDLVEVTWDVANTDNSLVNCQHVNIKLSTDGGFTYPYTLASFTPNDGAQMVYVPDVPTSSARLKIEAADNIFFDVSDFNFAIAPAEKPGFTFSVSSEYEKICVPGNAEFDVELYTASILNFDSLVHFEIVGGLPLDATYEFSSNPVVPGESATLHIDMTNVKEVGDFMVELIAVAPNADTAHVFLGYNVLNNDFSALKMLAPANGLTNVGLIADFQWEDVPNADLYDIEIATSPQFGSSQIVDAAYGIEAAEFTPDVAFVENQLYYWRIRPHNSCGTGDYLTPFAFHTFTVDCTTFQSSDVPKNLPIQGTPTIPSELIVTQDGTITDVNIKGLKGEHDALADIAIYITSPSGTKVKLFDDLPCYVIPFNFTLDDEAAFDIACPPIGGLAYRPQEPLSAFDGETTFGTWLLEVKITDPIGNGGFLSEWGVQFCSSINPKNPYVVNNNVLQVPELGDRAITKASLLVEDEDNSASELIYTLVEAPKNGTITAWGTPKTIGHQFTQTDINSFGIRYQHEVAGTVDDFFTFVVEDGQGGFVGVERFNIEINDDAPVSTTEVDLENNLLLFPNPADNLLNIAVENPINEPVSMSILDVTGKVIDQRKYNFIHQNIELNTAGLSPGIYFLHFQMNDAVATKRFIIQR
ncbi:MAG: T9SS C-terminal target domain-containing protein [Bacteroidetes bacterium]|nr:MAG: T9SS C-terminal target domain-containing protein [Bacteroidota bacterium]